MLLINDVNQIGHDSLFKDWIYTSEHVEGVDGAC